MSNTKIYTTIGASNHSVGDREDNDFYATEPLATMLLLQEEKFNKTIWECACGAGHIGCMLENEGYDVIATDLVYRGYGEEESFDFLEDTIDDFEGDIITNPPYKYVLEFAKTALDTVKEGNKVALFLKLTFLEGQKRKKFFFDNPPKRIYVSSSRLICAKNGNFDKYKLSAVAYAWFVWEKGSKTDPIIKWIN